MPQFRWRADGSNNFLKCVKSDIFLVIFVIRNNYFWGQPARAVFELQFMVVIPLFLQNGFLKFRNWFVISESQSVDLPVFAISRNYRSRQTMEIQLLLHFQIRNVSLSLSWFLICPRGFYSTQAFEQVLPKPIKSDKKGTNYIKPLFMVTTNPQIFQATL